VEDEDFMLKMSHVFLIAVEAKNQESAKVISKFINYNTKRNVLDLTFG